MSFTSTVKDELALMPLGSMTDQQAELAAFVLLAGSLTIVNKQWQVSLISEHPKVIKRVFTIIKHLYQVEPHLLVGKKDTFKKNALYKIEIETQGIEILTHLGLYTPEKGLIDVPAPHLIPHPAEIAAFIRGAFMAVGSVNSPDTSNYHLELMTHHEPLSQLLVKLLLKFDITSKISIRRGHHFVYVKKSEAIGDLLRVMQASRSLMDFESTRIQRDQYISMTRVINCEIANEVKAQEKARQQLDMIERLQELVGLDELDPKVRQVADLRIENPEASTQELVELFKETYGIRISKSGIIHRFEKMKDLLAQFEKEGSTV